MLSVIKTGDFTYKLSKEIIENYDIPPIRKLVKCFEESCYEIRLVGGAVRDLLLGGHPQDFDFATNALPDQIIETCHANQINCYKTGIKHGTITVVIEKINFEVTTLRTDEETDGRRAVVRYINDWRLDAERRDLTINAMSISYSGILYDYFTGVEDLKNRHIRFVKDPTTRIREDHLRILRFFRFYGKIGQESPTGESYEIHTLSVIKSLSSNLKNISKERIWSEFSQILVGPFAPSILKIMNSCNVLDQIGLENVSDIMLERFSTYYQNSINRRDDVPKILPCSLLSAFFDNLESAESFCRMLKVPNIDRKICCFLVDNISSGIDKINLDRYKKMAFTNNSSPSPQILDIIIQLMLVEGASNEYIIKIREWSIPLCPVKAQDLKPLFKGPNLGKAISDIKRKWVDSGFKSSKEDLISPYISKT